MSEKYNNLIVNTDKMADLIGRTRQRVNQLEKEGILTKNSPGKWPLFENIKSYILYLENGQRKPDEMENQAAYWEEKALHENIKRRTSELNLKQREGELHEAADVEAVMTNMLVIFRNRCLAMPQKIAPKVIGMTNIAEISAIISEEVHEALVELSDYDPALFAGGDEVEAEDSEPVPEDIEERSTAAEADSKRMGRQTQKTKS